MSKEKRILDFFEYSKQNIIEIDYLIKLLKKFDLIETAKESIFQFNPKFDNNGRTESFSVFHKKILIGDIIYFLIEKLGKKYINQGKNLDIEDFSIYFQNIYLDNEKSTFVTYILKNNILEENLENILFLFEKWNKKEIENYFNNKIY